MPHGKDVFFFSNKYLRSTCAVTSAIKDAPVGAPRGDDFQFLAFASKPQDGFEKVGAFGSIDPAGTKDQVFGARSGECLLPRELGLAVNAERAGGIGWKRIFFR
jgi:hypothetical protein